MAHYVFRNGIDNAYELNFIKDACLYLTWPNLEVDLRNFASREHLMEYFHAQNPQLTKNTASRFAGEIWTALHRISPGDTVYSPISRGHLVHIGVVSGHYSFNPDTVAMFRHRIPVEWRLFAHPSSLLPEDVSAEFNKQQTVFALDVNQHDDYIQGLLAERRFPNQTFMHLCSSGYTSVINHILYNDDRNLWKSCVRELFSTDISSVITISPPFSDYCEFLVEIKSGDLSMNEIRLVHILSNNDSITEDTLLRTHERRLACGATKALLVSWNTQLTVPEELLERGREMKVGCWNAMQIVDEINKHKYRFHPRVKNKLPEKYLSMLF